MAKSEKEYLKLVGENIARIRLEKGLSQLDVCAMVSMEKSNLSTIENGRQNITLTTLLKIAKALNVKPHSILKLELDDLS